MITAIQGQFNLTDGINGSVKNPKFIFKKKLYFTLSLSLC